MIEVLKAGLWTTVQDHGRIHARTWGVPVSGAMDRSGMDLANALLNNKEGTAVLEITLVGPELKFHEDTWFCLAGADLSPTLNGKSIDVLHPCLAREGDVLKFGIPKYGIRTYLSVSGGFKTITVLGSKSQYAPITGQGRLSNGDYLETCNSEDASFHTASHIKFDENVFKNIRLKAFPGPEYECLNKGQKKQLWKNSFTISSKNNRMAYQLNEPVKNAMDPIITSHVLPGTVQLTPSGRLIVLMRDAQTTGGYPRVLQLTEASINILSQKYSSESIQFERIDY